MYKGIALTVGGSDSGGGAGIQADLKTFMALGIHGCSAITCVTAQNSLEVNRIDSLTPESIKCQIETVLDDFKITALKTGMLLNQKIIETTSECLNSVNIPKLIDPVMVSRSGKLLIEKNSIEAYKALLIKNGEIVTPNIYEASILGEIEIKNSNDVQNAAIKILNKGVQSILIKGGGIKELQGKDYFLDNKSNGTWLEHNYVETTNTHGSGCTLIAAITAYRARNINLKDSIENAKLYLEEALKNSYKLGKGPGCLYHPKNK